MRSCSYIGSFSTKLPLIIWGWIATHRHFHCVIYIPRITPVSHAQIEIVQIVAILVVWYWYDGMCHPVKNAGSRHRVFSEFTAIYGMLMDAMLGYQDSDPSSNVAICAGCPP